MSDRSSFEQLRIISEHERGNNGIHLFDRAKIIIYNHGFIPTTRGEINRAFGGVIANEDYSGGTGRHLNEILRHQINHATQQPAKAVIEIVNFMNFFRIDASNRRDALRETYDILMDDVNPRLRVDSLVDELSPVGLLSAIQYHDLSCAISNSNSKPFEGGIRKINGAKLLVTRYDASTHDDVSISMLIENLPDTVNRVHGFRNLVLEAGKSQKNRRNFWTNALRSSKSHMIARPLIEKILNE